MRIAFRIEILDLSLSIEICIITFEFSSEIDTFWLARKRETKTLTTGEFFIN